MLEEFKRFRQVEGITRKLFSDNFFDLYLWYKKNSQDFLGFQLVFSVDHRQMALTAEIGKLPNIRAIESGDGEFYSPTDLLDEVGYFPKTSLFNEFKIRSENLDHNLRENILKVIRTYNINDNDTLELCPLY